MPKKEKQGVVISNKMDKTIVVKVADYEPHPKYKKIMEKNRNNNKKRIKYFRDELCKGYECSRKR